MTAAARKVGLSLSGGGHLLPYYLGVGQTLVEAAAKSGNFPRIHAVSGSSAGAIAAVMIVRAPDLIGDYANRFIEDRGNALQTLTDYVSRGTASSAHLYICTTKCRDGSVHLFDENELENEAELLECVRASCTIPRTFHPYDVLAGSKISYPDSDGILIRGEYHVDGGIAGPAPPVLNCSDVIIVSPISGSSKSSYRISPTDTSFALWTKMSRRFGVLCTAVHSEFKGIANRVWNHHVKRIAGVV